MSLLDAATNDLASLINRLDLEATPGSTNNSPLKLSTLRYNQDSPTKKRGGSPSQHLDTQASITSLRPFAKVQAQSQALASKPQAPKAAEDWIGQPIAPWSSFEWKISPKKPADKPSTINAVATKKSNTSTKSSQRSPAPKLRLIIRRLPPGLTEAEFWDVMGSEWQSGNGKVEWHAFKEGKISREYVRHKYFILTT